MIRLFAGLPLPEELRERLGCAAAGIPHARWERKENLHITLRFIGEVDPACAEDIHDALSEITASSFALRVRGFGAFQSGHRTHTLWAGVERDPALVHLRDKIESCLVRLGLEPEARKYTPHITVAKLKNAPIQRVQTFIAGNNLFQYGPMEVGAFVLFSSHLSRSGAEYSVEAEYPLRPASPSDGVPVSGS